MPQMSPLNWFMLLIYMIMIFMLFNSINYYIFQKNNTINKIKKINLNKFTWMW
uniref:ATP synthase complex subunit 8 n=1 Tax=Eucinetus haemorrhoidalis TaxID=1490181 RepID=A0A343A4A8_9COLE|nr:ATP synthase F0 subunit 8 [Eucinetus haemorrhoidalis]AOY39386.1 ATP synthase F0 subunit 8 [Eucinetus haemorrhoidalis]